MAARRKRVAIRLLLTCHRKRRCGTSCARGRRAHAEDVDFALLAVDLRKDLVPVHLCFAAKLVRLGNENFLCPSSPIAALRCRTYSRTVDSPTPTSGISCRNRVQMRRAVCRCLRGALRSASRIASINGSAGASFGRSRSGFFRSGGTLRWSKPDAPPADVLPISALPRGSFRRHVHTRAASARIAPPFSSLRPSRPRFQGPQKTS